MRAYVLAKASPGLALELARRLRQVSAIKDADAVGEIQKVEGVFKTTTCLSIA